MFSWKGEASAEELEEDAARWDTHCQLSFQCQWPNPHASKLHQDHVACFKGLWRRTFEV
jgi:hypothetical protein